ncbi:MAG TPA: hypothetical protein VHM31_14435, partial [Polyangia bacterium]|nr:hypothetical protein [Polyangia bacterium]
MRGSREDGPSGGSWTVRDRRDAPSSRASAPAFSPGDVVLERYELREILGRGGMGIVFRAH